jgi:thiamine monophosphate synthase
MVAAGCPVPVVAIGGIDLERAYAVGRATHLGAVIAGLLPDDPGNGDLAAITERARALHAALGSN